MEAARTTSQFKCLIGFLNLTCQKLTCWVLYLHHLLKHPAPCFFFVFPISLNSNPILLLLRPQNLALLLTPLLSLIPNIQFINKLDQFYLQNISMIFTLLDSFIPTKLVQVHILSRQCLPVHNRGYASGWVGAKGLCRPVLYKDLVPTTGCLSFEQFDRQCQGGSRPDGSTRALWS